MHEQTCLGGEGDVIDQDTYKFCIHTNENKIMHTFYVLPAKYLKKYWKFQTIYAAYSIRHFI